MRSYLAVVVVTVLFALLLGSWIIILNEQGATVVVSALFLGLPLVGLLSVAFIGRLVWHDKRRPRSWLLLFLLTIAGQIVLGLGAVDWLLVRRLLGAEPLGLVLSTDIYAIALWLIGAVPPEMAVLFWLVQREGPVPEPRRDDQAHQVGEGDH